MARPVVLAWVLFGAAGCSPTASSTAGHDAGSGPGTDAGPLVAQCQQLALNFQTRCAGSAPRPCLWQAYGRLCATGNTQLLIDSMRCLDASTCRTFSDPNQGAACLGTVHATGETAAVRGALQALCAACDSGCTSNPTAEIIPYLADTDLAALPACGARACVLDGLLTACGSVPGIAPFVSCAGM